MAFSTVSTLHSRTATAANDLPFLANIWFTTRIGQCDRVILALGDDYNDIHKNNPIRTEEVNAWEFAQKTTFVADCIAKADLVFLLDSSSSVGRTNFNNMVDFVAGVLQDADIDDGQIRVGAMTFG